MLILRMILRQPNLIQIAKMTQTRNRSKVRKWRTGIPIKDVSRCTWMDAETKSKEMTADDSRTSWS